MMNLFGKKVLVTGADGFIGTSLGDSVPVSSKIIEKYTAASVEEEKKLNEKGAQEKLREECLNGIAYSLAKAQLAKMTQTTVNWINSGFKLKMLLPSILSLITIFYLDYSIKTIIKNKIKRIQNRIQNIPNTLYYMLPFNTK